MHLHSYIIIINNNVIYFYTPNYKNVIFEMLLLQYFQTC